VAGGGYGEGRVQCTAIEPNKRAGGGHGKGDGIALQLSATEYGFCVPTTLYKGTHLVGLVVAKLPPSHSPWPLPATSEFDHRVS